MCWLAFYMTKMINLASARTADNSLYTSTDEQASMGARTQGCTFTEMF